MRHTKSSSALLPLLAVGLTGLVVSACASEPEPHDQSFELALRELAALPLSLQPQQFGGEEDDPFADDPFADDPFADDPFAEGPNPGAELDDDRNGGRFDDSDTGLGIIKGMSTLTGTGAGNGGVGGPTGAGNGGVGAPTGAGNGGAARGAGYLPEGSAARGSSFASTTVLAEVLCDFVGSMCLSFSRCSQSDDNMSCGEFLASRGACYQLVDQALQSSPQSINIPSRYLEAIRCIGNQLESVCPLNLDEGRARAIYNACGLAGIEASF